MPQTVSISQIEQNPFQSRKRIDKAAVTRLAGEIREQGFWDSAFRVRARNGHYQLVVGHQRLEALRELGHKRIAIEVVDLDDVAMAQQSLIENIQRDNLGEMDKAEGIARVFEMMTGSRRITDANKGVTAEICKLLGYHLKTITEFLDMANMSAPTKDIVRRENLPRTAARVAHDIGGERMVRVAAAKRIERSALEPMRTAVQDLPKESRQKVVDKIISKQITNPDEVRRLARREVEKGADLDKVPPDIMMFIEKWTGDLKAWTKKIEAATKAKTYIHQHPEIVGGFKNAAEEFWAALKALLDL